MSVIELLITGGWGFVGGLMVGGMLKDKHKEDSAK